MLINRKLIKDGLRFNNIYRSFKQSFTQSNKLSYQKISSNFWKNKTPDINSMCGFGALNEEDLLHTKNIFTKLNNEYDKFHYALDVGAGIGRITFNFLYDICDNIDLLDFNKDFLEVAKKTEESNELKKIRNYYDLKIQNFKFENKYNLIYIQWVLEYIDDVELEKFLIDARNNLEDNGLIIIKENINIDNTEEIIFEEEGSIVRPYKQFEKIFNELNFQIYLSDFILYKSVSDICEMKYWILRKS